MASTAHSLLLLIISATASAQTDGPFNYSVLENDNLFEGDIKLTENQLSDIDTGNFAKDEGRWPEGVIPYLIHSSSTDDSFIISMAMQEIELKTCLGFFSRTSETDYLIIRGDSGGCWSYVGRIGGAQTVSIGRGCEYKSTIVHELMHATGFWHEQSRQDRDNYVTIHFENIWEDLKKNFNKQTGVQYTSYDYISVMHYSAYAFSKNGQKTIVRNDDPDGDLGQPIHGGLSELDAEGLNQHYGCISTSSSTTETTYRTEEPETTTVPPPPPPPTTEEPETTTVPPPPPPPTTEEPETTTVPPPPPPPTTEEPEVTTRPPGECETRRDCINQGGSWQPRNWKYGCQGTIIDKPCPNEDVGYVCCLTGCTDVNSKCKYWANLGECYTNPSYMLHNCRRACEFCDQPCKDRNDKCEKWKEQGECDKNPIFMLVNCRKSCKLCGKGCKDKNEMCSRWARDGGCENRPTYMITNCPKTCRYCDKSGNLKCKDKLHYPYCSKKKEQGYCKDKGQRKFMKKYCMETCNFC